MPKNQVANVENYDFGAPAVQGEVLKFRAPIGGKLDLKIEAINALTGLTVQVSPDGPTWANTTAPNNVTAVANISIAAGQDRDYSIALREGTDAYVRLLAGGGGRGILQIRRGAKLEIVRI